MKSKLVGLFVAFVLVAASPLCRAEEVFASPMSLFAGAYVPVMEKSLCASLKKTLRGFVLRADSTNEKAEARLPSDEGISLDVSVRDAAEIPAFEDTSTNEEGLIKRIVRFPASFPSRPGEDTQGLVVILIHGRHANPSALAAIAKSIDAIKRPTEQK
jgi:hypothetical protein